MYVCCNCIDSFALVCSVLDLHKSSASFVLFALFVCASVLDQAKRFPKHLVTDTTSDTLWTESKDFAKASDEELPLVNGDLDASGTPWHMHRCKGRSTLRHPLKTAMKMYLLLSLGYSNAGSERLFSAINKINICSAPRICHTASSLLFHRYR